MKKTITHPDGREEVLEGSPEELAEYENKINPKAPSIVINPAPAPILPIFPTLPDVTWPITQPTWPNTQPTWRPQFDWPPVIIC